MKKFIVANWKMNLPPEGVETYCEAVKNIPDLIIAPPASSLSSVSGHGVKTAGQNISPEKNGAFTGDLSGEILKTTGAKFCLVGHSEQRQYHPDDNAPAQLIKKINILLQNGITPIYCVGETKEQKQKNHGEKIIAEQLKNIPTENIWVAYEPVWAIGTKIVASEDDIVAMHRFIKKSLPTNKILYGGSVNQTNAKNILALKEVDGLLIGGASLSSATILNIISACP